MRRIAALIGLVIMFVIGTIMTVQARPATDQYYPQTGFVVAEPILSAFNRFGGVPLLGLPISATMDTTCEGIPCVVQWHERGRIEVHQNGQAYRGRIGADYLAGRGTPWVFGDGNTPDGCQAVPETGHAICEPFLSAWQQFGGVERLGLPISEVQQETYVDRGTGQTVTFPTQWFERGALEDQGSNVQLRLLGSQTYPTWAEQLLAELVNNERANVGLPVLIWDDGLATAARGHSEDLARHNQTGHTSTDGRDLVARTQSIQLPGYVIGEVISYRQSPPAAIQSLMNSPQHKEIILYPESTHFGTGYGVALGPVRGDQTPATVWTVDFWVAR